MNKNSKYYIIKDKNFATTMAMLCQVNPYIYPNKFEEGKFVWSFENTEKFQETLKLAREMINNNK